MIEKGIFGHLFTKYVADKSIEIYDEKANGVISISKYFYDFYHNKGQNTIWIPPVFDIKKKETVFIINLKVFNLFMQEVWADQKILLIQL